MAHTWEIEYRGTLADGASGGDKRTIAAWGLSELGELTEANLARGGTALTIASGTAFLDDLPWSYRDKIVLWRDGVRHWHGWLTAEPRAASPESESATLVFGDPWWWFEVTTMTAPTVKDAVTGTVSFTVAGLGTVSYPAVTSITWAEPSGDVVFAWRDQSSATIQGQIRRAFYAVTRGGAPLALGSIGVDAPAPPQDVAGTTALSYLQSACTYEPNMVGWWDYSGATPALHCQLRSALSATSYSLAGCPAGVQCEPLRTEQALAVRIRWHYPDSNGDDTVYTERAGNDALPIGPNVLVIDANVSDADALTEAVSYGIAARMYASIGPLAYGGALTLTDDLTAGFALRPGRAINITGGRTEWATMAGIVQQTTLSVTADADTLSISWGAPRHLGVQDWLALRDIGNGGASSAKWEPDDPATSDPKPGTFDDLNNNTPAPAPTGAIAIQTRGGTWTKCGYSSYNGTQPTRRWLVADSTQTVEWNCGDGPQSQTRTGHGVYNPASCGSGPTNTGSITPGGWEPTATFCSAVTAVTRGLTTATATAPTGGFLSIGTCCGSDTSYTITGGSEVHTLSSEDTEEAAFARRLAVATWTEGGHAVRTIPQTIASGVRASLRFGTYVGETYTQITGLSPWHRYRIAGRLEMLAVDETGAAASGATWTDRGEIASPGFIADLDGKGGETWQYVEPTAGYATRIADLHVEEW